MFKDMLKINYSRCLRKKMLRQKEENMVYTIGEMAQMLDVPTSTLRYYDKEGLLPFVERSNGGMRVFKTADYEWLQIIGCLKKWRHVLYHML